MNSRTYTTPCAGFEWDTQKAESNLEKHKISFEVSTEIFNGYPLSFEDQREYGEVRTVVIGDLGGVVVYVVCTVREPRIRIISARKASKEEREAYNEHIQRTTISDPSKDE